MDAMRSRLAILLGVLLLAGCDAAVPSSSVPDVSGSMPASQAPFAPTFAASATPAVSAAAALIPDGAYAGPVQQVADVIALMNGDRKLSDADKADMIDTLFEIRGHTTFAVTLDLHAGQWTEWEAVDGKAQVGSRATYVFPDDHTLVIQESCCGLTTFGVTLVPGGFRLKAPPQTKEEDKMVGTILFETGAFTRVP
jgi:hypothetical protein